MYFTRDPVVETVITSREGYKLTIRSTKNPSFEPIIVEALEVVSLGGVCFFRNSDRSKSFLLPVIEFEIIETRDARVNLKALGLEKGIKIAGGRTASLKIPKDKVFQPLTKNGDQEEIPELCQSSDNGEEGDVNPVTGEVVDAESGVTAKSKKSWKEKKQKQYNKKKLKGSAEERVSASDREDLKEGRDIAPEELNKKFSLFPPPALLISEVMHRAEEIENKIVEGVLSLVELNSDEIHASDFLEMHVSPDDSLEEELVFLKEEIFPISSMLDNEDL